MMNLLFSPNGRISQPTYWKGVWILTAISAAISAISAYVMPFIGILGLVFLWPWIAVHVKRFHDSGKTGWITIAMVVLAFIVSTVASMLLLGVFGVDMAAIQEEMMQITQDNPGDIGAVMEATKEMSKAQLLPSILGTVITTAVVGFVMGLINKSDPGPNQYGAPEGGAIGDTF